MKDGLSVEAAASDPLAPLEINGEHKVNVLFSGRGLPSSTFQLNLSRF
jgi:hypothetical protein